MRRRRATIAGSNPLLPGAELARYRHSYRGLPGRPDDFDYTLDYQMIRGDTLLAAHAWTFGGEPDRYPSDHLALVVDYRATAHPRPGAVGSPGGAAGADTAPSATGPEREPATPPEA